MNDTTTAASALQRATDELYRQCPKSVAAHEHRKAMSGVGAHASAMRRMIEGAARYVDAHRGDFDCPVADDHYCGPELAAILVALERLLSGPIGGLDGGTCDRALHDIAKAAGWPDGLEEARGVIR